MSVVAHRERLNSQNEITAFLTEYYLHANALLKNKETQYNIDKDAMVTIEVRI